MNKKQLKEKWLPFFEGMNNHDIKEMKELGYWCIEDALEAAYIDLRNFVYER